MVASRKAPVVYSIDTWRELPDSGNLKFPETTCLSPVNIWTIMRECFQKHSDFDSWKLV